MSRNSLLHSLAQHAGMSSASARRRAGDPPADVLDVSKRLGCMFACEGILTGWIALAGEVVEPARVAIDIQLLGEVWAIPPRAAPLTLAGRDVEPAAGAPPEVLPSCHRILLLDFILRARKHPGEGRTARAVRGQRRTGESPVRQRLGS